MSCFKMLYWIEDMRVVLFKWAFCVISKQCYRECSENIKRKKTFILRSLSFKKQNSKRSVLIFADLSCKSTINLYCAKCYKCNKKDFWKKRKKKNHLDFISLLMYCCDLPNALDTAVGLTAVLI